MGVALSFEGTGFVAGAVRMPQGGWLKAPGAVQRADSGAPPAGNPSYLLLSLSALRQEEEDNCGAGNPLPYHEHNTPASRRAAKRTRAEMVGQDWRQLLRVPAPVARVSATPAEIVPPADLVAAPGALTALLGQATSSAGDDKGSEEKEDERLPQSLADRFPRAVSGAEHSARKKRRTEGNAGKTTAHTEAFDYEAAALRLGQAPGESQRAKRALMDDAGGGRGRGRAGGRGGGRRGGRGGSGRTR